MGVVSCTAAREAGGGRVTGGAAHLARELRDASARWRDMRSSGTAREPDRPRATYPPLGHVRPVSDLVMAIVDALELLDDLNFEIVEIASDYTEDRIVWAGPGSRFVEVGCSSGAIVMVGYLVDGDVPPFSLETHRHARDVVPADVAGMLESIELEPGETDIRTVLTACATWARAALDALPPRASGR